MTNSDDKKHLTGSHDAICETLIAVPAADRPTVLKNLVRSCPAEIRAIERAHGSFAKILEANPE
jgi:hypothetical protein